jgi:hypothetical protein
MVKVWEIIIVLTLTVLFKPFDKLICSVDQGE